MNLYYLEHNGEQLPISLSYKTLQEFQSKTKASWNDIDTNIDLYPELIMIALKNGYAKENATIQDSNQKKVNQFNTKEKCIDLLDDLFFDFQALIMNEFVPDVQKKMIRP